MLVGGVYAICVLGVLVWLTAVAVFSDADPDRSEGPVDEIIAIATVGTAALIIGVGLSLWVLRAPERAGIGTFVLTGISVLTIVLFWSGAPGIFGACAAWTSGLTRGARPQGGAVRVAGIIGAVIAVLNVVVTVGGTLLHAVFG